MVAKSKAERQSNRPQPRVRPGQQRIDLEYIDSALQQIFSLRHNKEIESRIRFKVQDLMDRYEAEWKAEINEQRKSARLN